MERYNEDAAPYIPVFGEDEKIVPGRAKSRLIQQVNKGWELPIHHNEVGGEVLHELNKVYAPKQYLAYLLATGIINLAPVIKHEGKFYSREIEPTYYTTPKPREEINAEVLVYALLFQDYDHSFLSENRAEMYRGYGCIREDRNIGFFITFSGEIYYEMFDYGDNAFLKRMAHFTLVSHLESVNGFHPIMLTVIQRFKDRYEGEEGRTLFDAIIDRSEMDGEISYEQFWERIHLIETRFKQLEATPEAHRKNFWGSIASLLSM